MKTASILVRSACKPLFHEILFGVDQPFISSRHCQGLIAKPVSFASDATREEKVQHFLDEHPTSWDKLVHGTIIPVPGWRAGYWPVVFVSFSQMTDAFRICILGFHGWGDLQVRIILVWIFFGLVWVLTVDDSGLRTLETRILKLIKTEFRKWPHLPHRMCTWGYDLKWSDILAHVHSWFTLGTLRHCPSRSNYHGKIETVIPIYCLSTGRLPAWTPCRR